MEVKNVEGVKMNRCPLCKSEMKFGYAFDMNVKHGCFTFCDNCNLYFGLIRKEADSWMLAGMYDTQKELSEAWNKATEKLQENRNDRPGEEISEWKFLKAFAQESSFDNELCCNRLRSLWTAYCSHHNLDVNTPSYDMALTALWGIVRESESFAVNWYDGDSFDDFMSRYLV